jgi:Leucine-rich repeat (LRR) protein
VSNNSLTCLPESLGELPLLSRLEANNNQLSQLPKSFVFLHSLRVRFCFPSSLD